MLHTLQVVLRIHSVNACELIVQLYVISKMSTCMEIVKGVLRLSLTIFTVIGSLILINCVVLNGLGRVLFKF